jgi:hypothetical protein
VARPCHPDAADAVRLPIAIEWDRIRNVDRRTAKVRTIRIASAVRDVRGTAAIVQADDTRRRIETSIVTRSATVATVATATIATVSASVRARITVVATAAIDVPTTVIAERLRMMSTTSDHDEDQDGATRHARTLTAASRHLRANPSQDRASNRASNLRNPRLDPSPSQPHTASVL